MLKKRIKEIIFLLAAIAAIAGTIWQIFLSKPANETVAHVVESNMQSGGITAHTVNYGN